MFTGLVEKVGEITRVEPYDGGLRLEVAAPFASELELGESVCTSGVCLSVVACGAATFTAEVMPESVKLTTLGQRKVGDLVNLERALGVQGRFGGHIVTGHVDGVAEVLAITETARWCEIRISLPPLLAAQVVRKGSICLDGVSLTVTKAERDYFEVALIPLTLAQTTLGELQVGSKVNLETDVLAKYLERLTEMGQQSHGN